MINRENYEIWFIDYLDGKLDDEGTKLLKQFLSSNPDLEQELNQMQQLTLEPDNVIFEGKDQLKKNILEDKDSFDTACVNYIEGNASTKEKAELLAFSFSRPEKVRDLHLFKSTKLDATETFIYPHKEKLYRSAAFVVWKRVIQSAAAILIGLFIVSAIWITQQFNNTSPVMVKHQGPGLQQTQENKDDNEVKITDAPVYGTGKSMVYQPKQETKQDSEASMQPQNFRVPTEQSLTKLQVIQPRLKSTRINFDTGTLRKVPEQKIEPSKPKLLAGMFRSRNHREYWNSNSKFQNAHVAPTLLNLLGEVSDDKLTYTEKDNGSISEISYDSKLLSFSLPVNSKKE